MLVRHQGRSDTAVPPVPERNATHEQERARASENEPLVLTQPNQLRHCTHEPRERGSGPKRHEHCWQYATDQCRRAREQSAGCEGNIP